MQKKTFINYILIKLDKMTKNVQDSEMILCKKCKLYNLKAIKSGKSILELVV